METIVEMSGEELSGPVAECSSPMLLRGLDAVRTPRALKDFLRNGLPDDYRGPMSYSEWSCSTEKKMGYVGSISDNWKCSSASDRRNPSSGVSAGRRIRLTLADDTNDGRRHSLEVGYSGALKVIQ